MAAERWAPVAVEAAKRRGQPAATPGRFWTGAMQLVEEDGPLRRKFGQCGHHRNSSSSSSSESGESK